MGLRSVYYLITKVGISLEAPLLICFVMPRQTTLPLLSCKKGFSNLRYCLAYYQIMLMVLTTVSGAGLPRDALCGQLNRWLAAWG